LRFKFCGKFNAYGPAKDLPQNRFPHPSSNKVWRDYTRLPILPISQLADDQLCFVFARRRSETILTKGNATVCESENV
jgi:hypothetical protein